VFCGLFCWREDKSSFVEGSCSRQFNSVGSGKVVPTVSTLTFAACEFGREQSGRYLLPQFPMENDPTVAQWIQRSRRYWRRLKGVPVPRIAEFTGNYYFIDELGRSLHNVANPRDIIYFRSAQDMVEFLCAKTKLVK